MLLVLGKVGISRTTFRYIPLSPNQKMHWGLKARWTKAWQEEVYYRFMELSYRTREYYKNILRKTNEINIYLYTQSPQDEDNSYASIKPILDGLKGLVIFNDSREYVILKVLTQKVEKKTEQKVIIEILDGAPQIQGLQESPADTVPV